ncbi:MAG: helix-hairpin-helix domain-containing protein, partial [Chloroflexi bacterium]|nr:helix-hairpin-helix domain-containing protein [Chloroflexota bacterium]
AVDDKLVSLAPELGERLILAFQNVSDGADKEKWSLALTSCRRLLTELADKLYPPRNELVGGRKVGKEEYINRLWAFMDEKILSEKNCEVAKAHVDLVGSHLQSALGITNKGVHAEVTRLEAVRVVFHTYLVIADVLSYIDRSTIRGGPQLPNLHSVGRDEIMAIAGVKEEIANEVIKLRANQGRIRREDLVKIKGVGLKTVEHLLQGFSLDYPPQKN